MSTDEHGPRSLAGVAFLEVEDIEIAEWCPTDDGTGPPEQVHMIIKVGGLSPLRLRFKSPRTLNNVIGALRKHRDNVWPPT